MMKKRLPLLLLCMIGAMGGYAQHRLSGTVVDGAANTPVLYATVVLLTPDSTFLNGGVTDETGRFALENVSPGAYRVEVTYLGYEKISRTVNVPADSEMGRIALSPSANELDAVVVRGNMIRRRVDGYVFNPAGSGVTVGRNSLELLSFAPGVWTTANGAISINGRSGTRVMVNDRLLNISGEELAAYLQNINAEQIQSIEVIPQAGSQFDASFTGGILKITLKRNTVAGLTGSVGLSVATQEIEQASPYYVRPRFNLDYRRGKVSLYGSFSYAWDKHYTAGEINTQYLSGSQREVFRENYNTATPEYLNSRLGAVYEISDKHSVGVDVDIHHMDVTSVTTAPGWTTVGEVTSELGNSFDMERITNNRNLSFNYKWKTDDRGSGLMVFADWLYADRGRTEHNYSEEIAPDGTTNAEDQRADIPTESDVYTLRADYTQVLNEKFRLAGGVKMNYLDLTLNGHNEMRLDGVWSPAPELDNHVLYRETVLAGYVSTSAKLGRWNLSGGMRAENTRLTPRSYTNPGEMKKQNYTDLFPSFNAMYAIDPQKGHFLNMSYARTIRRPGLEDLSPFRVQSNNYTYSTGNPHLKAYYMNSLSLTGVLKNSYSLTLGFDYENDVITNITQKDPDNPDVLMSMPVNIDRVTQYYAALSIPVRFTDWWRLNTDLIGDYTSNKMSEYSLNGTRFQGRVVSIFSFPKNFAADITYMFTTGQVSGDTRVEPKINFLSLNVRKSFLENKLTVNFFADNILEFSKWTYEATTEQPDIFSTSTRLDSDRRTYGLTLRWNFRAGKEVRVQKVTYGNTEERAR